MSQISFSPDWLRQFSDPYAVLGLSVTADDRRVLKRYRTIAKLLHPDSYINADRETGNAATQMFARLVSPTYQKLKQDKGRAENLALLRFRVRRMNREDPFAPTSDVARRLLATALTEVDVFYEQAVSKLAETQYIPLIQFETVTQQLGELNLAYLQMKMGGPMIREKRAGIMAAPTPPPPMQYTATFSDSDKSTVDYAQRHYHRAQEYAIKANWAMVVRELQDAMKIDPHKGEYHSLLAKAYLMQDLPIMAKVHFRQALKLNAEDPLALMYAKKFNLVPTAPTSLSAPSAAKKTQRPASGGLFGLFAKKR